MIAIDTNLLVYAHRAEMPFHAKARELIETLAQGRERWAIPWPCLHEFLAVVTRHGVFKTPTPAATALDAVDALVAVETCELLAESDGHMDSLRELALRAKITGPMFHDARIAAICLRHGVGELWSADRDFSRFPQLRLRNPLIA